MHSLLGLAVELKEKTKFCIRKGGQRGNACCLENKRYSLYHSMEICEHEKSVHSHLHIQTTVISSQSGSKK